MLLGFCWNNDGELLEGICDEFVGAGKRGLNGVLAEVVKEALKDKSETFERKAWYAQQLAYLLLHRC
jgi:hypothetical protein